MNGQLMAAAPFAKVQHSPVHGDINQHKIKRKSEETTF